MYRRAALRLTERVSTTVCSHFAWDGLEIEAVAPHTAGGDRRHKLGAGNLHVHSVCVRVRACVCVCMCAWQSVRACLSAFECARLVTCISAPPACGPSLTPGSGDHSAPSAETAERILPRDCVHSSPGPDSV